MTLNFSVLLHQCIDNGNCARTVFLQDRKHGFFFRREMRTQFPLVKLLYTTRLFNAVMRPAVMKQCLVSLAQSQRKCETVMMILRKGDETLMSLCHRYVPSMNVSFCSVY